jgi:hypothetical protein
MNTVRKPNAAAVIVGSRLRGNDPRIADDLW